MTIAINHRLFFDKETVSLLELAIHITSWLSEIKNDIYSDFDYSADDYQENPVLHFTEIGNQHYTISSAWVNSETAIMLNAADLVQCFTTFLQELANTMQQVYGVAFADIPLLKPVIKSKGPSLKEFLQRFWS